MRSKAPLAMTELVVMLLVFAFSAAVCLQVFALSDRRSERNEARDRAVLQAECAAEVLKSCHGDVSRAAALHLGRHEDGLWRISFDGEWNATDGSACYTLLAEPLESTQTLLGLALISVSDENGEVLAELRVGWQEVQDIE